MIKNYFKIAYRILTRNKVFSFINIFGLSIALTSVIIIFLFISHELSFDKYHSNFDRIYRVVSIQYQNGKEDYDDAAPVPLTNFLRSELTGKDHVTQIYFSEEQLVRIGQEKYLQNGFLYADSAFTKVFDVDFIVGNPKDLANPREIFLTRELAEKYFGSVEDAVNKEIEIMDSVVLNVAGVVENPPKNTHIPYQSIVSWSTLSEKHFNFNYNNWGTRISGFCTYLTLNEGVDVKNEELQIKGIVEKNNPKYDEGDKDSFHLQALKAIHFDDRFNTFSGAYVTSKKFIWIFSIVALFILVIAFINFTNLSIVQTIKRAKEVGIRKVLGADRRKLVKQFLGETFLLLFIAEVISLIFTEVVLDKINSILGNNMELKLYGGFSIVLFLLIVLISLSFLSGIYPAMVLSKYNPIKALRYNLKSGVRKSFSLYNLLVVFQFVISLVLIVSAIVVSLQMNYFKNKDLGFDKENVITIDVPLNQVKKANTLAEMLKQNPHIKNVSLGIGAPISGSNIVSSFQLEGDLENDYYANVKTVDSSYYRLYNLNLIEGEWFSNYKVNDSTYNIVVTKSVLKDIQIQNPKDALGVYLRIFGSLGGIIVGVVDDFHAYSLQNEIPPVIFLPLDDFFAQLNVKIENVPYSEVSSYIEKLWNDIFPEYVYKFDIVEENINKRYSSEERFTDIVLIFAFIAIVIACLGLYGLVSFMLMQRTKEIGIRKALGASVPSLVMMVSKQFLKLVLVSCVFAWPIAYYLMKNWLNNYAYKIDLNIWIFITSGVILLLITFITILYQAIKVSLTNPVEVLKYE